MSCILTQGYSIPCKQMAGVYKVYIGTYNGPSMTTVLDPDGTIGTFSGATVSFYGFAQPIESASFTAPIETNVENNAIQYNQTLSIYVHNLSAANINTIKILGQGVWRVIILDRNGNYYYMGKLGPVQVTAGDTGLGKGGTDLNGAMLTFTSKEDQILYAVKPAAALSVIQE